MKKIDSLYFFLTITLRNPFLVQILSYIYKKVKLLLMEDGPLHSSGAL